MVMAPHSSTLAWKIPWTEELGRLQSIIKLSKPILQKKFFKPATEKNRGTHVRIITNFSSETTENKGWASLKC